MIPFLNTFAPKPIAMYTVYDEEEEKYTKVEEPDASLTNTYADYLKWKFEERLELFRGKIFKMGAPDLVVEILSPGNSKKEIHDKYELYEEAGVKEYWVVNPTEQNIFAFAREPEAGFGPPKIYTGGDRLNCRCISGISLEVNEIFTP
jgi:Uma2 family endonuclease